MIMEMNFSSTGVQGERPRAMLEISYPDHLQDHLPKDYHQQDHPSKAHREVVVSESQEALEK